MHWTTKLLNKYKEALVAFDTDYVTGYHFLRVNELLHGICWYLDQMEKDRKAITYVMSYVSRVTGRAAYLAEIPFGLNAIYHDTAKVSEHTTRSIKVRIQHLHKMREELDITEPLL